MSDDQKLDDHIKREDPMAIAGAASKEEIDRLIAAEELLEKRYMRKRRTARWATIAQQLVGWVALAGFFANAYQNWNNKKQAEERARQDEERWGKEFKRAQDSDKYRAFFETSALATDSSNADKRLVGYALLKEFVDDSTYNQKATFMLEESLALELRDDHGPGLDEPHRAAVTAILGALSHTSDCRALVRAARTVQKVAVRHAQQHDEEEAREVVGMYVLRLVGRAAQVCQAKDLLDVRKPIRDVMMRAPEVAGLPPRSPAIEVDKALAKILMTRCQEELDAGVSECADVPRAWKKFCDDLPKLKIADGAGLCVAPPPVTQTPPAAAPAVVPAQAPSQ